MYIAAHGVVCNEVDGGELPVSGVFATWYLYYGDNVEQGPEGELETRQPGEETGRVVPGATGLLLPATTPAVVAVSAPEAASAEAGNLLVGEPGRQATGTQLPETAVAAGAPGPDAAATSTTVNPYLDRILASTRDMQVLLQSRSLQIASLEQQLMEMRQRMRDAQQVTARLNAALEQALQSRGGQGVGTTRGVTVLGMVALVLLLALLVAMAVLLKLAAQLRNQREEWSDDVAAMEELAELPISPRARTYPTAATLLPAKPRDSGMVVEEYGMSAAEEDAGLQQELLELIGPAVRDEPGRQDHDRNGA